MLQLFHQWHVAGIKVALLMMEFERVFWEWRLLSQLAKNYNLAREEWCKDHAEEARAAFKAHEQELASFRPCLHVAQTGSLGAKDLLAFIQAAATNGTQIIGIDPITAMDTGDDINRSDKAFLLGAKIIIRETGARLFLTTHAKKGSWTDPDLHNMALSANYPRFCQTVLWLQHVGDKVGDLRGPDGELNEGERWDRVMHIEKATLGPGGGKKLAFQFRVQDFSLVEVGEIERKS